MVGQILLLVRQKHEVFSRFNLRQFPKLESIGNEFIDLKFKS